MHLYTARGLRAGNTSTVTERDYAQELVHGRESVTHLFPARLGKRPHAFFLRRACEIPGRFAADNHVVQFAGVENLEDTNAPAESGAAAPSAPAGDRQRG